MYFSGVLYFLFDSHYHPYFCVGSLTSKVLLCVSYPWEVVTNYHHMGFLLVLLFLPLQLLGILFVFLLLRLTSSSWKISDSQFRSPLLLLGSPMVSLRLFADSFIGVLDKSPFLFGPRNFFVLPNAGCSCLVESMTSFPLH